MVHAQIRTAGKIGKNGWEKLISSTYRGSSLIFFWWRIVLKENVKSRKNGSYRASSRLLGRLDEASDQTFAGGHTKKSTK